MPKWRLEDMDNEELVRVIVLLLQITESQTRTIRNMVEAMPDSHPRKDVLLEAIQDIALKVYAGRVSLGLGPEAG